MNAMIDSQLAQDLIHAHRRDLLAAAQAHRLGRMAPLARRRGRAGKPRRASRAGAPLLAWLAKG